MRPAAAVDIRAEYGVDVTTTGGTRLHLRQVAPPRPMTAGRYIRAVADIRDRAGLDPLDEYVIVAGWCRVPLHEWAGVTHQAGARVVGDLAAYVDEAWRVGGWGGGWGSPYCPATEADCYRAWRRGIPAEHLGLLGARVLYVRGRRRLWALRAARRTSLGIVDTAWRPVDAWSIRALCQLGRLCPELQRVAVASATLREAPGSLRYGSRSIDWVLVADAQRALRADTTGAVRTQLARGRRRVALSSHDDACTCVTCEAYAGGYVTTYDVSQIDPLSEQVDDLLAIGRLDACGLRPDEVEAWRAWRSGERRQWRRSVARTLTGSVARWLLRDTPVSMSDPAGARWLLAHMPPAPHCSWDVLRSVHSPGSQARIAHSLRAWPPSSEGEVDLRMVPMADWPCYRGRLDLTGADLRGVDLREVDFTGADLRGASLTGADLRGVDLSGVYAMGFAHLEWADLKGATLPTPRASRNTYWWGAAMDAAPDGWRLLDGLAVRS